MEVLFLQPPIVHTFMLVLTVIMMTKPNVWRWTAERYRLARHIAEGDTYREAGKKVGLAEVTVKTYMWEVNEFRAYVDKITLENEMASRAGVLRMLMRVAKEKLPDAAADKSTYLDYLKFIRELADDVDDPDKEFTVTFK